MSDYDTNEKDAHHSSHQIGIVISSDDARQGETGRAALRVLALGMVGTILVNLTIVIYFAWLGPSVC